MGKKSCLHLLLGTYTGLATPVNVFMLLPSHIHVSGISFLTFQLVVHVHLHGYHLYMLKRMPFLKLNCGSC